MLAKVALIGRPNVGKSTLFNRLIRSNRAITHDRPGVTRDRMEGVVRPRGGRSFVVIDTGGVTLDQHRAVVEGPAGLRGFEAEILRQTEAAIREAAVICLVTDGREGLLPLDEHLAAFARRGGKPVLLVVNKVDGPEREDERMAEFHALGFPMLAVSAEHGHNIRALESELIDRLPPEDAAPRADAAGQDAAVAAEDVEREAAEEGALGADGLADAGSDPATDARPAVLAEGEAVFAPDAAAAFGGTDPSRLKLALLGRPNAGKSSLINALIGEERMIVSDVAGTTRDSVDIPFAADGRLCVFVDTAGVRRRTRLTDAVERFSVNAALKSTTKADVTLYVIDALEGVTSQDKRLIDLLDERKTPFLILVNKIDLVNAKQRAALHAAFRDVLQFCPHVPALMVSAMRGLGLDKIVPLAARIREECQTRIGTGALNRALEEVLAAHQPPVVKRVRPRFFYLTQAEVAPPTFVFFVSDADRVSETYARYLERSLRRRFGILHAPMRVRLRSSHGKRKEK